MSTLLIRLTLLSLLSFGFLSAKANPSINNVTYPSSVELYEKFEVNFDVQGNYNNPYSYREIEVTGMFEHLQYDVNERIDGFFYRQYEHTCSPLGSDQLIGVNGATFALRYTPRKTGTYRFSITATDVDGTTTTSFYTFTVYAVNGNNYPGFINLHPGEDHFAYEDGTRYLPIATNMAFAASGKTWCEFDKWLTLFSMNGGNSVRIWTNAYWGFSLEGNQTMSVPLPPGNYNSNQRILSILDQVFDRSKELDVNLKLCLNATVVYSDEKVCDNPYQIHTFNVNCQNVNTTNETFSPNIPNELFFQTNAGNETWEMQQNRHRYFIARYGYATNLEAYEVFNETELIDDLRIGNSASDGYYPNMFGPYLQWNQEIIDLIDRKDIYNHPITTSHLNGRDPDAANPNYLMTPIYNNPLVDFTEIHAYSFNTDDDYGVFNYGDLPLNELIYNGINYAKDGFNKPAMVNEFLWQAKGPQHYDPNAFGLHQGMWTSYMAGTPSIASPWFWKSHLHEGGHWGQFFGISSFVDITKNKLTNDMEAEQQIVSANGSGVRWTVLSGQQFAMGYAQDTMFDWRAMHRDGTAYLNTLASSDYPGYTTSSKTVQMEPNRQYFLEWYDTHWGNVISSTVVHSDANGNVTLTTPNANPRFGGIAFTLEANCELYSWHTFELVYTNNSNLREVTTVDYGHAFYRNNNGSINSLYCDNNDDWQWSGLISSVNNVYGDLVAHNIGHVFYKSTTNSINSIYYANGAWNWSGLAASVNNVAGDLTMHSSGNQIFYRSTSGSINSIYYANGTWNWSGLNNASGNNVAGDLVVTDNGRVYYRTSSGHINYIYWNNGSWAHSNMNNASGTNTMAGDLAADEDGNVFYKTNPGKLWQCQMRRLYEVNGVWTVQNLNSAVNHVSAQPNSIVAGNGRVFYRNAGHRINSWVNQGGTWSWDGCQSVHNVSYPIGNYTKMDVDINGNVYYHLPNGNLSILYYGNQCDYGPVINKSAFGGTTEPAKPAVTNTEVNEPQIANVYPNPAMTELNVFVSGAESMDVYLYNSLGQEVLKGTANGERVQLDLSDVEPGVLIVVIRTADGHVYTEKVIRSDH